VLTRIGETGEGFSLQLAEAARATRSSFKAGDQGSSRAPSIARKS
jgi:putative ATP-dependent endonuclease of OLD family